MCFTCTFTQWLYIHAVTKDHRTCLPFSKHWSHPPLYAYIRLTVSISFSYPWAIPLRWNCLLVCLSTEFTWHFICLCLLQQWLPWRLSFTFDASYRWAGCFGCGQVLRKYLICCYLKWERVSLRHDGLLSFRLSSPVKKHSKPMENCLYGSCATLKDTWIFAFLYNGDDSWKVKVDTHTVIWQPY